MSGVVAVAFAFVWDCLYYLTGFYLYSILFLSFSSLTFVRLHLHSHSSHTLIMVSMSIVSALGVYKVKMVINKVKVKDLTRLIV